MDAKPVSTKCCFFTKLKSGCMFMVYFLLVFQSIVGVQALFHWITKGSALKILEIGTKGNLWKFVLFILSVGLTLAVSIATISYMFVLFVRLHKDKTKLMNVYLTFSAVMLTATVVFCLVCDFVFDVNPITME